jgi:hypothetical protein
MKKFFVVAACLFLASIVAAPANSATLGLEYLVGTVSPDNPANPDNELAYANNLINWYNAGGGAGDDPSGDPAGPPPIDYTYLLAGEGQGGSVPDPDLALATGGVRINAVGEVLQDPVPLTGYTYVFAKFGQDGALYYLDGSITSLDGFDPAWGPFSEQGGGLSHVTLFGGGGTTRVPEAGALVMFGSGLIGLVGYRRMRRMQ